MGQRGASSSPWLSAALSCSLSTRHWLPRPAPTTRARNPVGLSQAWPEFTVSLGSHSLMTQSQTVIFGISVLSQAEIIGNSAQISSKFNGCKSIGKHFCRSVYLTCHFLTNTLRDNITRNGRNKHLIFFFAWCNITLTYYYHWRIQSCHQLQAKPVVNCGGATINRCRQQKWQL